MKLLLKTCVLSLCLSVSLHSATTAIFSHPSLQSLYLLDTLNQELQARIDLAETQSAIALTADNADLFTATSDIDSVDNYSANNPGINNPYVVPNLNTKSTSIAVGSEPVDAIATPLGDKLLTANYGDDSVSILDVRTKAVVATPATQSGPVSIAVTPNGEKAVVANNVAGSASIIDLRTYSVSHVDFNSEVSGARPYKVAITPDSSTAYLTDATNNAIYKMDIEAGIVMALLLPDVSTQVAVTPKGKYALALSPNLGQLNVISTADDSIRTLKVGANPVSLAVTSTGSRAYTANSGSNDVSVISLSGTPAVVARIGNNFSGRPVAVSTTQDQKNIHILYDSALVNGTSLNAMIAICDLPTNRQIKAIPLSIGTYLTPKSLPSGFLAEPQILQPTLTAIQAQSGVLARSNFKQIRTAQLGVLGAPILEEPKHIDDYLPYLTWLKATDQLLN